MGWFAHFGIVSKFQKKKLVCKFFGQKRRLLQKKYYIAYSAQLGLSLAKSVSSETFFGPQKLRHPKIVSNSWDIAEMDKYYQDICCLDKCQLASIKDCPRSLPLDFGLNVVSISWDIPDMVKCFWGKCILDNCHHDSCNLFYMLPGAYAIFEQYQYIM